MFLRERMNGRNQVQKKMKGWVPYKQSAHRACFCASSLSFGSFASRPSFLSASSGLRIGRLHLITLLLAAAVTLEGGRPAHLCWDVSNKRARRHCSSYRPPSDSFNDTTFAFCTLALLDPLPPTDNHHAPGSAARGASAAGSGTDWYMAARP